MRIAFVTLTGLYFLSIGYVYPFVVVFRTGTFGNVVSKSWLLQLAFIIVLSISVPKFAAMISPELGRQMLADKWVPDTPAIVPIMVMGWMTPLVGGGLGLVARRFCQKRFPVWMDRISTASEQ